MQLKGIRSFINDISKERNIAKSVVVKALENAYKSFARKKVNMIAAMEAEYNEETDEMNIFQFKKVVEKVKNSATEISLTEAQSLDPESALEDDLGIDITDSLKFSRNDVTLIHQMFQNAVQKEIKDKLITEFSAREGQLVSGIVKKVDFKYYLVDLGSTEAILYKDQCIGEEKFEPKDRVQAVLTKVDATPRGAEITLSRATPMFVVRLMEQDIAEVGDGLVEIVKIAREPGLRTKILLRSKETALNPVQVVVGSKGYRIQNLINQLNGEKVNVYPANLDSYSLLNEMLKPAKVSQILFNEDKIVVVPESEDLGKVVGARGSNLKTLASIMGKVVEVVSEEKYKKQQEAVATEYRKVLPELLAQNLVSHNYTSVEKIKAKTPESVAKSLGVSVEEINDAIEKLSSAELTKVDFSADAYAYPKEFKITETRGKVSSADAEKRLREEIRANLNLK